MVDVIFGLGFGDEGKGQTVCHTAHRCYTESGEVPTIVRYSGGCQNEHNVRWVAGKKEFHHTYSQIGASGYFSGDAMTFTWKTVPVDLEAFLVEASVLYRKIQQGACLSTPTLPQYLQRHVFHEDCLFITPLHRLVSMDREETMRHGSTNRGIYPAKALQQWDAAFAMTIGDFAKACETDDWTCFEQKRDVFIQWLGGLNLPTTTSLKVAAYPFKEWLFGLRQQYKELSHVSIMHNVHNSESFLKMLGFAQHLVFEGGQGVLLDKDFGFFPNVTYANSVPSQAVHICKKLDRPARLIGVTRGYATRHGAGFFPYENCSFYEIEPHNPSTKQLPFRTAPLSEALFNYALSVTTHSLEMPVAQIAVTRFASGWPNHVCVVPDGAEIGQNVGKTVTAPDIVLNDNVRREIIDDFANRITTSRSMLNLLEYRLFKDMPDNLYQSVPEIERF